MIVNDFLKKFLSSILVKTLIDVRDIIVIGKRESRLEFDLELVVQNSDRQIGYIEPGKTQLRFQVDSSLEKPHNKSTMLQSLY